MSLRILVVPDKFKGTLSAREAATAIERGWRRVRRDDTLELLPMSDGGEGFGAVMSELLGAVPQTEQTYDAAHRPCSAVWWWDPRSELAIIESARVVGLAMLPPGKYHPFQLDTMGLGGVLQAARAKGAKRCLLGIGGSATNDGGFGMARAIGWEFLDDSGRSIHDWTELRSLVEIVPPARRRQFQELTVAVDVQNRLLGPRGATRVYGPQKGILPQQYRPAETCLRRMARLCHRLLGTDFARCPGTGAAGGLGFGLMAFAGGRLESGFEIFAKFANLKNRVRSADVVITGEGSIDRSTAMGKGVGQVAEQCWRVRVPCIGLAGILRPEANKTGRFALLRSLTEICSVEVARSCASKSLERLAADTATKWDRGRA